MERVPGDVLLHASILYFKTRLENRCKLFPVYALLRASILDFRARLANRCKLFPDYTLLRASILDFKPKLGNRCSTIVVAVENGPPATAVAATIFRVRFKFLCSKEEWPACYGRSGNDLPRPILITLQQRRTARWLQHRCCTEEWFRLQDAVADAGGDWMSRRRHNPK